MENIYPLDPSVLVSQPTHRSHFIWTGQLESDTLLQTQNYYSSNRWLVDDCSHKFISTCELSQVHGVVARTGRTQGVRVCNVLCVLVGYRRCLLETITKSV